MGLLATEGIGVFSQEHVVLSSGGKCLQMHPHRLAADPGRPRGIPTHTFVWEALKELLDTPASSAVLFDYIFLSRNSLNDWLMHFASAPATTAKLASDWLKAWALDIERLAKDRDARKPLESLGRPRFPPLYRLMRHRQFNLFVAYGLFASLRAITRSRCLIRCF